MDGKKSFISYVKYFSVGAFIVVVVSAAVFLVYTLSLRRGPGQETSHNAKPELPSDTSHVAARVPAETTAANPAKTVQHAKPETPFGLYTVYIASYVHEPPADEEVGRWNSAGYIAAVVNANHHYRVALGQYESVNDARRFAEQMSEAFENGYWIGPIE